MINRINKVDFFIVIISVLMMFVVLNFPFKVKPLGDLTFHKEAKNLSLFLKGDVAFDQVTITKAPGPVLFYTPIYTLVPEGSLDNVYWEYGVVFTFICITIAMLLIYRIGCLLFSKEVGLLSVILFFIFPIHFYYTLGILAEIPAFFALTIAIYGWARILEPSKSNIGWIFFTIGIWMLILSRPNSLLVVPIGFIVVVYSFFKNKTFYKSFAKKIAFSLSLITVLAVASLQIAKSITGNKVEKKQSELFFYVAHQGRFQFREEPFDLRYWESDVRPDSKDYQNWKKNSSLLNNKIKQSGKTYDKIYQDFLITDIVQHPFWFLRQGIIKVFYGQIYIINSVNPEQFKLFFFKGKTGYIFFLLLINSINLLILIGFIIFLFKEKQLLKYWIFWSVILALLLFHAATYMEPRYLFPMRITLYLMSAAGLMQIKFVNKIINRISKKIQ